MDRFGNLVTTDHSKILLTTNTGTFTGTNAVPLNKGVATFSNIVFKTAGTYTLTATPATTSTLAITTPISVIETINKATTNTLHTPVLKAGGYTFGNANITLSTTLTSNAALASVPFTAGTLVTISGTDTANTFSATASISSSGLAKFSFGDPTPGLYTCTLTYPGDANHTAGTSGNFTLLVKKAGTVTTLTPSLTSLTLGQTLTLTAAVTSPSVHAIPPTGSVIFSDNGTPFSTLTLNAASVAAMQVPAAGVHQYTAVYSSDPDFLASSATAKPVTDNVAPSSIVGQTIFISDMEGTGNAAPPLANLLSIAGTGHTLTNNRLGLNASSAPYSYTYTKTGPATGTLVAVGTGSVKQTITTHLTFVTPTSGTAQQTFSGGGGTNTVTFVLLGNPVASNAPANVLGATITLNVTAGAGVFASSGSMLLSPNASGNTFTLTGYPGNIPNSSGTYNYFLFDAAVANFEYSDTVAGTGQLILAFTSPTSGSYYNLSDFDGWQAGTFTLE